MDYELEKDGLFHQLVQYLRTRTTRIDLPTSMAVVVAHLSSTAGELDAAYVEHRVADEGAEYRVVWINDGMVGEVRGTSADADWDGYNGIQGEPNDRAFTGWVARTDQLESIEFSQSPLFSFDLWQKTVSIVSPIKLVVHGREVSVPEFKVTGLGKPEHAALDELMSAAQKELGHSQPA